MDVALEYHDEPGWSRSLARNRCLQLAETPLVCVSESDILLSEEVFLQAVAEFGDKPFARLYVHPMITKLGRDGRQLFEASENPEIGYAQIFRTEDGDAIGGYNPFLENWGWEDSDFSVRLAHSGVERRRIDAVVAHQWHPAAYVDDVEKQRLLRANQELARLSSWDGRQWTLHGREEASNAAG